MPHNSLFTQIKQQYQNIKKTGLANLSTKQKNRKEKYLIDTNYIRYYANNLHIDANMLALLSRLGKKYSIRQQVAELLKGRQSNPSEGLKVAHPLLRSNATINAIKNNVCPANNEVVSSLLPMLHLAKKIYNHSYTLSNNMPPTDIIHLGAGGSALGPQLLLDALTYQIPAKSKKYKIHFISNIDGHPLKDIMNSVDPSRTLVIANSKSFNTTETLENFHLIKKWKKDRTHALRNDYLAITSNPDRAMQAGFTPKYILSYPGWIGGRYSIFSPVGFLLPAIFGRAYYLEFLQGACSADKTGSSSDISKNPALRSALSDFLYHRLLKLPTRCILTYDKRLSLLLPYVQQLEMESNSKSVSIDNKKIRHATSPIVWGGTGTDCQHSIFQTLYQGTHIVPTEFITVKKTEHKLTNHHNWLLANARAQQIALREGYIDNSSPSNPSKNCIGNKPSSHIQLENISPSSLGALISYYEMRTFIFGKLLNINSFDQMGVEFSKPIAKQIFADIQ